jgi:hypothetical protein
MNTWLARAGCPGSHIRRGIMRRGILRSLGLSLSLGKTSSQQEVSSGDMRIPLAALSLVALGLSSSACQQGGGNKNSSPPIVGTWFVKIPEAPFHYHMFVFHPDGTMQQSNPDAGDPNTSDSNGMGAWVPDGEKIKGKFVEVTADRTTRQFVSRGEISFLIKVNGNALSGTASAVFYDAEGRRFRGPLEATMVGERVFP